VAVQEFPEIRNQFTMNTLFKMYAD